MMFINFNLLYVSCLAKQDTVINSYTVSETVYMSHKTEERRKKCRQLNCRHNAETVSVEYSI